MPRTQGQVLGGSHLPTPSLSPSTSPSQLGWQTWPSHPLRAWRPPASRRGPSRGCSWHPPPSSTHCQAPLTARVAVLTSHPWRGSLCHPRVSPFSFTPGWRPALYWVVPAPFPGSRSVFLGFLLSTQMFLSLPRGFTVTSGGSPLPFLALSSGVPSSFLRVPPSIPLVPLSARRVHTRFRGSPLPTGPSLCPGMSSLLSRGSNSLFPEILLPARGMCSPVRRTLLPSRGSQCLFPGVPLSVRAPLGSSPLPSRGPGVPFSCRGESAPFWCGSRSSGRGTGVPPARGAAAAAWGGAGAGAGAHPRCRWRGGAAAPSAIKRAAAPVPQRGRGSP